jgi:hypothetical protein
MSECLYIDSPMRGWAMPSEAIGRRTGHVRSTPMRAGQSKGAMCHPGTCAHPTYM